MGGVALAQGPDVNNASTQDAVDCTVLVPPNPLTARGLATPYRLVAPCHEANPDTAAFVQATIIDPASGQVSVYDPLVIDENSNPAVQPRVPRLPDGAVIGLWFGFNGDNLRLRGSNGSLRAGHCVNGLGDSIFGQFAYCNAPAFFATAAAEVTAGRLHIPALGTARDNQPCPSVRDFALVDMDQSDNVTTSYLSLPDGRTAQNTSANAAALSSQGARIEINGSDNALLDAFVDPALGCVPFTAPDLAEPGRMATSLALNELQAGAYQAEPVALVPMSDPMTQTGAGKNIEKTNLYRAGVGQPSVNTATETPQAYCLSLVGVGVTRTRLDRTLTRHMVSPDSGAANSLFTFLAQRLSGSFDVLGCGDLLGVRNPVRLVTKGGVVVDARFTTATPPSTRPSGPASASPPPSAGPTGSRPPSAAASASTSPAVRPGSPSPPAPTGPGSPAHPATPTPHHSTAVPPPDTSDPDSFMAAPVIRPGSNATPPADPSSGDPSGESPGGNTGASPTKAATPATPAATGSSAAAAPAAPGDPSITVEPMKVRGVAGADTRPTSGIRIPRFAGGVLVGSGTVFFVGLIVYAVGGKRRQRDYISY